MARIFISYRRVDSEIIAGRIYDRLRGAYGPDNIFKDVYNIPAGEDFRTVIKRGVQWCDVMLVIIGPQWVEIKDNEGRRRLENKDDYVRVEAQTALTAPDVTVLPVLVKGARPPRPSDLPDDIQQLAYINAIPVRNDPDFDMDIARLINSINTLQAARMPTAPMGMQKPTQPKRSQSERATVPKRPTSGSGARHATDAQVRAAATTVRRHKPMLMGLGALGGLALLVAALFLFGVFDGADDANNADPTPRVDDDPVPVGEFVAYAATFEEELGETVLAFSHPKTWQISDDYAHNDVLIGDVAERVEYYRAGAVFPRDTGDVDNADAALPSDFIVIRLAPIWWLSPEVEGSVQQADTYLLEYAEGLGAEFGSAPHELQFGDLAARGLATAFGGKDLYIYAVDAGNIYVEVQVFGPDISAYSAVSEAIIATLEAGFRPREDDAQQFFEEDAATPQNQSDDDDDDDDDAEMD